MAISLLTVNRASTGYIDDLAGNWNHFPASTLRRSNKGVLVEETRVNSIRNNSMQGAAPGVVGSDGALPTNWAIANQGTLTVTVIAIGVADGVEYIDIRISGTVSTGNFNLRFETTTAITAATGQTWAASAFVALIAGSLAGLGSANLRLTERTSGGTMVATKDSSAFTLTSEMKRFEYVSTLTGGGTVERLEPCLRLSAVASSVVDATFRIGWPQLEQGAFVTSPIRTTGTAATRNSDGVSMVFEPGQRFTVVVQAYPIITASNKVMLALYEQGNTNNRVELLLNTTNVLNANVVSGGATQASLGLGSWTAARRKIALAVAPNDFAAVIDGGAPVTDVTGVVPSTLNRLSIGNRAGGQWWNSYIEGVKIYPMRLSNAQMQALTR